MYRHNTIKVHVHCTVHLDGAVNLQINITNDLYSYNVFITRQTQVLCTRTSTLDDSDKGSVVSPWL